MRIAVVTNSVPFPARHGVELPVARLVAWLAERHEVDLVVTGTGAADRAAFEARRPDVPGMVARVLYVATERRNRWLALAGELAGLRPAFETGRPVDPADLDAVAGGGHDAIWVSPPGGMGLVAMLRAKGHDTGARIGLGLNDAGYVLHGRGLRHVLRGRFAGEWRRVLGLLRVPWIALHERRYLRRVDLVHVQTPLEERRARRLLFLSGRRPRFVAVQNGRAAGLSPVAGGGGDGRTVLFMTHLARGRRTESQWFLRHVWPKVLSEEPEARLWLVGSPPGDAGAFARTLPANVEVRGFVPDLGDVFAETAVAVVPTLHHSGWVNRISDYLQAGLPVVACSEPASTIAGLVPGMHAITADRAGDFADQVVRLLRDRCAAARLAAAGRALAATFPIWDETTARIEAALVDMVAR